MNKYSYALVFAFVAACLAGCKTNPAERCEPVYGQENETKYGIDNSNFVDPNVYTPKNVWVDMSGLPVNLNKIDRVIDEVEACLRGFDTADGKNYIVPQSDAAGCRTATFTLPICRGCLIVKVANDWHLSETMFAGSYQQLLPSFAGYGDCGKDLAPGICFWRAGIQDNYTIVTTPSFYVFKDPLVRLTTGCDKPWSNAALTVCMTPTTHPLDDGSEM